MPTYAVIEQTGVGSLPYAPLFLSDVPEPGGTFVHAGQVWSIQEVEKAQDPGYIAGTILCTTIGQA